MALTPDEIDALPTYTAAQMVKLIDSAVAELASNPGSASVDMAGRRWTTHDLGTLRTLREHYAQLASADAADAAAVSTGCPVVTYQEPQI